jgi:cell division septum initiation protein DivIVA
MRQVPRRPEGTVAADAKDLPASAAALVARVQRDGDAPADRGRRRGVRGDARRAGAGPESASRREDDAEAIGKALLTPERAADEMVAAAKQEAAAILAEARATPEKMTVEAQAARDELLPERDSMIEQAALIRKRCRGKSRRCGRNSSACTPRSRACADGSGCRARRVGACAARAAAPRRGRARRRPDVAAE